METTTIPGAKLRLQREAYGVTQAQMAAVLGHTRDTIRAWEARPSVDVRRHRLYLAALRKVADTL